MNNDRQTPLSQRLNLSVAALHSGDIERAREGLIITSRQLTRRAQYMEGDLQRRHEELALRFWEQAQRLQSSLFQISERSASLQSVGFNSLPERLPNDVPSKSPPAATPAVILPDEDGTHGLAGVIGADKVKKLLRARFVDPLRDPARAALYKQSAHGGLLLYGPPGTGKTFLVRALANELGLPVFSISPSEIVSKWLGDSEKQLAQVFEKARLHPASLIFVDEIDALAPTRDAGGDASGSMQRLLTQLLTELDGFERHAGCLLFVGATNRPWAVDPALLRPGRFDALAYVELPTSEVRANLLKRQLKGVPIETHMDWSEAAGWIKGCSAAETVACASQAARLAFQDAVRSGHNRTVCMADLKAASQTIYRAASIEVLARFDEFAKAHGLPPATCGDAAADLQNLTVNANTTSTIALPGVEPFRFVQARDLKADIEVLPFICYALQHSGIAPIRRLVIENNGTEESQNLVVELALVPSDYGDPWTINIAELPAGKSWTIDNISLPLRLDRLRTVQEKERAHIRITVRDKDEVLLARTQEVPVLAYNEWVFMPEFLELSAAFVQSNSPALHPVVQSAANRLEAACGSRAFSGYQSGIKHVLLMLQSMHQALVEDHSLDYINPPPSFEITGQKIRLVADTLTQGRGTCLDLAVLQAALWEHIGLRPCLVLVPGHAFMACWMKDGQVPQAVISLGDKSLTAKAICQAIGDGDLRLFNSVEVAQCQSLMQAEANAKAILAQVLDQEGDVHLIDIAASRANVTPLP